jgi:hypothetical protein
MQVSAIPLNSVTLRGSNSYQGAGSLTVPGSGATVGWLGKVAATVTAGGINTWVGYTGPLAAELDAVGGSAAFSNATLAALGAPTGMQGMALWAPNPGEAGAMVLETLTYTFLSPLPVGVSFLLWNPGASADGVTGPYTFTFTAEDGNQVVNTSHWSFDVVTNPFNAESASSVSVNAAGVVSVGSYDAVTNPPDTIVVAKPDAPITAVTVTALTIEQDAWGLALQNSLPPDSNPACFAAGTAIMTPRGPVPVERLAVGDAVLARFAGSARIVWVGRRRIALRRHARPEAVRPVRIRANAVAAGVPARDLRLSPDHAVLLGGVLIPVKYLINGLTVFQEQACDEVEYYHIELERHDALLAEALPAESYLDTGNRGDFEGGTAALALHPGLVRRTWEADSCAPLWGEGGPVDAVRALLLARALAQMAVPRAS